MPTLSVSELLTDTLDAFKVQVPALSHFSTAFTTGTAKKGDTITGHILKVPTTADYHADTGYENGVQESTALFEDVSVTLDQHKHVPVKLDYLDQISSKVDLYERAIGNVAFALGKGIVDNGLSKIVAANFSEATTESIANTDIETLRTVTAAMNAKGAGTERFGLMNSSFATALAADSRIASGDYHGQMQGANPYRSLRNIEGFTQIDEYPAFPANSHNLSAFFFDRRALIVATAIPNDPQKYAASLGIPSIANFETVTDPDSGLTLLGITWMKAGTFDIYLTMTLLWGVNAGKVGGTAGTKTDYAGHRIVTA